MPGGGRGGGRRGPVDEAPEELPARTSIVYHARQGLREWPCVRRPPLTGMVRRLMPRAGRKEALAMLSAKISNEVRKDIYRRDGYRCALCDSTKYLQVHHCVKRSRGGTNSEQNLVCLCADCHALAHGMNLNGWDATQKDVEQAIVEYLADYYAPDWNPWAKDREPWRREP